METVLHTVKRTFTRHPSPMGNAERIFDGKWLPVRNVLPASLASLLSQSDEDNSDSDDIDDCSNKDLTEYENDD